MKQLAGMLCAFALTCASAAAQTAPKLAFEVASIKPSPPPDVVKMQAGKFNVGMKVDKARVNIGFLSISDLISIAFKVKSYQISGPDWMGAQRFDIQATLPEGATEEQVPEMLQSLLADRFGLKFHHSSKEASVYALVVAKGGPKLKDAEPDDPPPADGKPPEPGMKMSGNIEGKGVVVSAGGQKTKVQMGPNGAMHMELSRVSMAQFAEMISRFLDHPAVDMTELKGNYQVAVDLTMQDMMNVARSAGVAVPRGSAGGDATVAGPAEAASEPSSGSIFQSVQLMGLKLESRKAPIDQIVIDHLEKNPTEN
jgi:uncharacterized protein (TIGR03435 family)